MNYTVKSAVAMFVFNRPEPTKKVFAMIKKARPKILLLVSDGARADKSGEEEIVQQTRDVILKNIDWDCELKVNFAESNMGCRKRMSSGVTWVFDEVEEAILLEDDCLPHADFFRYADEMLEKYRDNEKVFHICGFNFLPNSDLFQNSYSFHKYAGIWGWASWRRAWKHYDEKISWWKNPVTEKKLKKVFKNRIRNVHYWQIKGDLVFNNKIDTWDYQWVLTCLINNALCICPKLNLITNMGFVGEQTHEFVGKNYPTMSAERLEFPLQDPSSVAFNQDLNKKIQDEIFEESNIKQNAMLWLSYYKKKFLAKKTKME